jgi:hypothetical protein
MTKLKTNHFYTTESNREATADNLNSKPCVKASIARARFFAEHGPGAEVSRRHATPKEIRKALLAAEMARWECF